jgi:hypothetical protein
LEYAIQMHHLPLMQRRFKRNLGIRGVAADLLRRTDIRPGI